MRNNNAAAGGSSAGAAAGVASGGGSVTHNVLAKTSAGFLENLNARLAEQRLSGKAFAVRNLINSKALVSILHKACLLFSQVGNMGIWDPGIKGATTNWMDQTAEWSIGFLFVSLFFSHVFSSSPLSSFVLISSTKHVSTVATVFCIPLHRYRGIAQYSTTATVSATIVNSFTFKAYIERSKKKKERTGTHAALSLCLCVFCASFVVLRKWRRRRWEVWTRFLVDLYVFSLYLSLSLALFLINFVAFQLQIIIIIVCFFVNLIFLDLSLLHSFLSVLCVSSVLFNRSDTLNKSNTYVLYSAYVGICFIWFHKTQTLMRYTCIMFITYCLLACSNEKGPNACGHLFRAANNAAPNHDYVVYMVGHRMIGRILFCFVL